MCAEALAHVTDNGNPLTERVSLDAHHDALALKPTVALVDVERDSPSTDPIAISTVRRDRVGFEVFDKAVSLLSVYLGLPALKMMHRGVLNDHDLIITKVWMPHPPNFTTARHSS